MLEYSWFSMTISTIGGWEVAPLATRREGGVGLARATDVGVGRVDERPIVDEPALLAHAEATRSAAAETATERSDRGDLCLTTRELWSRRSCQASQTRPARSRYPSGSVAVAPSGHDPAGGSMTREETDVSVIGREAHIEGTLVSAGSLTIHGHLKGDISADGEVSV